MKLVKKKWLTDRQIAHIGQKLASLRSERAIVDFLEYEARLL